MKKTREPGGESGAKGLHMPKKPGDTRGGARGTRGNEGKDPTQKRTFQPGKRPATGDGGARKQRTFGKSADGENKPRTYSKPADGENRPRTYSKPADGERKPRTYSKPADGERKPRTFSKPADGERKPRSFGKPNDGEYKPRTYDKPADGERKPRTFSKPADGERKPRTFSKPNDGEYKPRTYGKPADGERKPRTYGKPSDGENKPRTYGKPADGERKPRTFSKPADGEHKPRTYGKPADGEHKPRTFSKPNDGEYKPRTYGKPADGERKPRTYSKPADGERKPRTYSKPNDGEFKPRTYTKPADGERRPRPYGKPSDGEYKPRTYAKPEEREWKAETRDNSATSEGGETKPRTFEKPVTGTVDEQKPSVTVIPATNADGEQRPRTYAKPSAGADGERRPRGYAKPSMGSDGERRPRSYAKPSTGTDGERRPRTYAKPSTGVDGERRPRTFSKPAPGADGERRFAPRVRMDAREVALGALKDVAMNGAFAAQALDRQLEMARLLPDDRRLATSIFYAAVENRIRIAHILKSFVRTTEPEISDILHIACAQLLYLDKVPDHAVVDEAVKQARAVKGQRVGGFVNGVLRNIIRSRDAGDLLAPKEGEPEVSLNVEHSVAPELMEKLVQCFGEEEAGKIASYLPEKRTQTVRPNLMTTTDEAFGAYLTEKGISWETGLIPHALLCENAGALANLDGYRTGMFSIQGEGSMLAALSVEPKPGMNILDACAAPGGKSALLCEAMNGTGRVYAWDVHEHRVELVRAAGRRLKLYNLRPTVRDARTPYEPFEAFLDAVLVDAPCTGLGVMADKPDLRLRFSETDVQDLVKLQREILENCAKLVKVGGILVYSTCTILPEENEEQVRDFLAHNPQFAPETGVDYLPEPLRPRAKDGMIQFFQHKDGIEGFFIARMRRKCL